MPLSLDSFRNQLIEAGVPSPDARTIVFNGAAPFLQAACESHSAGVKQLAKLLVREVFAIVNTTNTAIEESRLTPAMLVDVVKMLDDGKINRDAARKSIEELFQHGGSAEAIARRDSLFQIGDASAVNGIVQAVLQERGDLVSQYRSGKKKVRDALFGMVMKRMEGRGDPKEVGKALDQRLQE